LLRLLAGYLFEDTLREDMAVRLEVKFPEFIGFEQSPEPYFPHISDTISG